MLCFKHVHCTSPVFKSSNVGFGCFNPATSITLNRLRFKQHGHNKQNCVFKRRSSSNSHLQLANVGLLSFLIKDTTRKHCLVKCVFFMGLCLGNLVNFDTPSWTCRAIVRPCCSHLEGNKLLFQSKSNRGRTLSQIVCGQIKHVKNS